MTKLVEELLHIQWLQLQHDQRYHYDVVCMSALDRMKHMTLHFSKYVGALAENEKKRKKTITESILVDSFIISLCSANTINMDLKKSVESQKALLSEDSLESNIGVAMEMAIWTGRMAKACESLDHLECGDFYSMLSESLINLFMVIIISSNIRGVDLSSKRTERLAYVVRNKIFNKFLQ